MSDVNKLILMGRIVKDAESKSTATGLTVSNFSIATNRSRKNDDGTWYEVVNFFNLSLYGKRAESLSKYLLKGQQVLLDGHVVQKKWEKDGKKQSRIEIEVDDIKLIGGFRKKDSEKTSGPVDGQIEDTEENFETDFAEPQFDGDVF